MFGTKTSIKSTVISVFVLLIFFLFGGIYLTGLLAEGSTNPPNFTTCQSLYGADGDIASYDSGIHQIVGDGLITGSDNVYSQSNGSYLQCYCPAIGTSGTQTNWWLADSLSQEDVNYYVSMGWFYENGEQWNLGNHMYLAKNLSSVCAQVTPTPAEQSHGGSSAPVCNSPAVTVAPLYSMGNLKRIDSDSIKVSWTVTDSHSQKYGIYYGTSPDKLSWYTEVYGHETNEAVINLVPKGNIYFKICNIGDCGDQICGSNVPTVLGATTELPSTGAVVFILLGFAPVGYYLYKRFRLV